MIFRVLVAVCGRLLLLLAVAMSALLCAREAEAEAVAESWVR